MFDDNIEDDLPGPRINFYYLVLMNYFEEYSTTSQNWYFMVPMC